ncbi:MAG: hypothetical protein HY860_03925 [Chlamydiales bacterium]|nr:hypothetical protein [Chlamydiales bacterium]
MAGRLVKFFPFLFSILLIFTSTCFTEINHLIIHLDVNRTIIAFDKAQNKGIDSCLDSALAKRYRACWNNRIHIPINYYDYVYQHLSPGDRANPSISKERKTLLTQFLPYLATHHPALYQQACNDKNLVYQKTATENFYIFPSFYRLLDFLEEKKINYTVVFRTFGKDLIDIQETLKQNLDVQVPIASFKKNILFLDSQVITSAKEIYDIIKSYRFLAISDDFYYWSSNDEKQPFAKPMHINPMDPSTLCFFFDDNVEKGSIEDYNIVNPIDIQSDEPLEINPLIDHFFVVQVDMVDAILKEDYFISFIESGIKNEQKWSKLFPTQSQSH